MKDEIKDLIKLLNEYKIRKKNGEDKFYPEDIIIIDELWQLLDYITNLQEEKEELKMTNLALADDITKNKIIKQEVLTECCGIPIGEIPMLKIQNDEYKQRIDKAIEHIEEHQLVYTSQYEEESNFDNHLLNILQGKSDE